MIRSEQLKKDLEKILKDQDRGHEVIFSLKDNDFIELRKILSDSELSTIFASLIVDEESANYFINIAFRQLDEFKTHWLAGANPALIKKLVIPTNTSESNLATISSTPYKDILTDIDCYAKKLPEDSLSRLRSLKTLKLKKCTVIPPYFSYNNPALTDVYIPDTVTRIEYKAFNNCPLLKLHIKKNQHIQVADTDKEYLKSHIVWEE